VKDFDPEVFAVAAATALDLPLPEHCRPGVAANLARLAAMAERLLDFAPPEAAQPEPSGDDAVGPPAE
jgi:hypothetical protein